MNAKGASIPDLVLERYVLGELPPADLDAIKELAAADGSVRARLAELQESNCQILARYPAPWAAPQIRTRAGQLRSRAERRRRARRWVVSLAAAALAAAVLPTLLAPDRRTEGEYTPLKGSAHGLLLFRKTAAGSEALPDSSLARQGDLLQIVYRPDGDRYGAIFSVDGRGTLTWHLPAAGRRAAALQGTGPDTLGFAYELDDAPRWERFYLVTAGSEFDLRLIEAAAGRLPEGGGLLVLPEGFRQDVLSLKKGEGHESP